MQFERPPNFRTGFAEDFASAALSQRWSAGSKPGRRKNGPENVVRRFPDDLTSLCTEPFTPTVTGQRSQTSRCGDCGPKRLPSVTFCLNLWAIFTSTWQPPPYRPGRTRAFSLDSISRRAILPCPCRDTERSGKPCWPFHCLATCRILVSVSQLLDRGFLGHGKALPQTATSKCWAFRSVPR